MKILKCWWAGNPGFGEFDWGDAVFANSYKEARKLAWNCGRQVQDMCDGDYMQMKLLRQKEFDSLAVGDESYVCTDQEALRKMGWRMEGDSFCDSCGLAEYDELHPVCQGCMQCDECGCDCEVHHE